MNINIDILENAINSIVKETLEQLDGKLNPILTTYEAIDKFGLISAIVITVRDEAKEKGYSNEVLERIWSLKKESDDNLQMLFEKLD